MVGWSFCFCFPRVFKGRVILGARNYEEVVSLTDVLVENDGGFLGRTGGITGNFVDLADDEVFGYGSTGKGEDGSFGIEGRASVKIDDVGFIFYIAIVAVSASIQLDGEFGVRMIQGDDFDNRRFD